MSDTTDPDQKERAAAMDTEIVALRRQRTEFAEIGRRMAVKYRADEPDQPYTRQYMHERYLNALKAIPALEVQQHRAEQVELLNQLIDEAYAIAQKHHLAVSQGRVVRIGRPEIDSETGEAYIDEGAGEPVLDDGPKLQAIGEIRKLLERMAKVVGSDTPVRQELDLGGTVNYKIHGVELGDIT